jgi:riboflavin biosynthesis protein RibD
MDRRRLAGKLRRWPARTPAVHIVSDLEFMRRAFSLATAGVGQTGDNPSVGCVIVKDGVIVGEGATAAGGRPHAEELALVAAGVNARGATAYVTLEPCAKRSTGTPSCSDILIQAGVARVVIAASDPHPFANGVGVERLRAAGISVETGLLASEARRLNADFHRLWTQS